MGISGSTSPDARPLHTASGTELTCRWLMPTQLWLKASVWFLRPNSLMAPLPIGRADSFCSGASVWYASLPPRGKHRTHRHASVHGLSARAKPATCGAGVIWTAADSTAGRDRGGPARLLPWPVSRLRRSWL